MKSFVIIGTVLGSDVACTTKGGSCQSWSQNTCLAGYESGLCDGDNDRRCCSNCDSYCQLEELDSSQYDQKCTNLKGECKNESNYCKGQYQSDKCGGDSSRKCCVEETFENGDYYWNYYSGYALSGYASSNYVFDSLDAAQTRCIELSDLCAGVTKESSTRYTTRANYKFSSNSNYESWTKEVIWAANFVPRAQWGARPPKDITTFNLPAQHGVIGHHTAGSECFNLGDCIKNLQNTQNYHMNDRGWSDIGYNFLIGEDGRIYEGRGFYRQGAHCSNWNSVTLGFSVMGNFEFKLPNQAAIDAVAQLLDHFERRKYVNRDCYEFSGHRDHGSTVCPGDPLYHLWSQSYDNWHQEC